MAKFSHAVFQYIHRTYFSVAHANKSISTRVDGHCCRLVLWSRVIFQKKNKYLSRITQTRVILLPPPYFRIYFFIRIKINRHAYDAVINYYLSSNAWTVHIYRLKSMCVVRVGEVSKIDYSAASRAVYIYIII